MWRSARSSVAARRGRVGEQEGAPGEAPPQGGPEAVRQGYEEALVQEPVLVGGEGVLEQDEVAAAADRLAERPEDGR